MDSRAERRRILEQHKLRKLQEFERANAQIDATLDEVGRVRLTRQAEAISKELDEIDGRIQRLTDGPFTRPGPLADNRAILEDLFTNPPGTREELRELVLGSLPADRLRRLPADVSGTYLLHWLADRRILSNQRVPLLEVLAALSPRLENEGDRARLDRVVEEIAEHFGVPLPTPVDSVPAPAEQDASVLLVEIWSGGSSTRSCNVHARLYGAGEPESVYVREGDDALQIGEPAQREEMIRQFQAILASHGIGPHRTLVELALPFDLLLLNAEHWTDRAGDPWGSYLPLVVRSRDRLREPDLQFGWQENWDRFCEGFGRKMIERLWWMGEKDHRRLRGKAAQGNCIAFDFVPRSNADEIADKFLPLVSAGVPVAL